MRRAMLWALVGLICAGSAAQAGERFAVRHGGYGAAVAPPYVSPYAYSSFGLRLRGGYGRNGYAPLFGPMWGPQAYFPGAGKAADLRPHGSYVRPLGPSEMLVETDAADLKPDSVDAAAK